MSYRDKDRYGEGINGGTAFNVTANWKNGRSSGWLRTSNGPAFFDAPLISHIEGNLYVGGCQNGYSLGDDFKTVVSLFIWEKYDIGDDVIRTEFTMYDSPAGADFGDIEQAADLVEEGLARGKTLVHCQAGINRSNLVAARVLMRQGKTVDEAIALLREKRSPFVLSNQTFVNQLRQIEVSAKIMED